MKQAVAQSIQTNTDAVKQHFPERASLSFLRLRNIFCGAANWPQDVLTQINNHIKHAVSENSFLKDKVQPL